MKAWARRSWLLLAALLSGGVMFLLVGKGPGSQVAPPAPHVDWTLPGEPAGELAAADKVWNARVPWGAPPELTAAGKPPPPPPAVPVGVVATGRSFRAVFVTAGSPETSVAAGDSLPDGGRVVSVSRFHVSWIDGQGAKHEQELLADPLPKQTPMP